MIIVSLIYNRGLAIIELHILILFTKGGSDQLVEFRLDSLQAGLLDDSVHNFTKSWSINVLGVSDVQTRRIRAALSDWSGLSIDLNKLCEHLVVFDNTFVKVSH